MTQSSISISFQSASCSLNDSALANQFASLSLALSKFIIHRITKDRFLCNEEDEEVGDELLRRQKTRQERDARRKKDQEENNKADLEKEEKWKQLHMQMANDRCFLSHYNQTTCERFDR